MLNLANIVYLLLVPTTTSGFSLNLHPLSSAEKSIERAIDSSTMIIEEAYQNAQMTIETLVSQMELQAPYHPRCSNNELNKNHREIGQEDTSDEDCLPAECSKLFNELTTSDMESTIECSRKYLDLMEARHDILVKTKTEILNLLNDVQYKAKSCTSLRSNIFFGNLRAARCVQKAERKLPGIVKRAESRFSEVIKNAQKVTSFWVPDVAYCLAATKNPMLMAKWNEVCKAKKPSNDENLS